LEQLRDEYGYKKLIFTQSVAPFKSGELPLQHYNNLLCLSHLHEFADSVGLHQNDDIFSILERSNNETHRTSDSTSTKNVLVPSTKLVKKSTSMDSLSPNAISFEDINAYIVKSFLNALYPVEGVSLKLQSIGMEFLEMQRVLCANRDLKFLEFYSVGKSEAKKASNADTYHRTHPLLKQILSVLPKYKANSIHEPYSSLNSLVVARGWNEYTAKFLVEEVWPDAEAVKKALNPVGWNPTAIDFWHAKHGLNDVSSEKSSTTTTTTRTNSSITIVTNRNKCVEYLSDVAEKSTRKFKARAYLHWYEKLNIGSEQFENAFDNLSSIMNSYGEFTR
jgi:hypothetical protein